MRTKRSMGVYLSKLDVFEKPKWNLEQYPTDSDIAAEIIWHAHLVDDIADKIVVDLGCGTGILGIAALLAGAKKVYFIDIDKSALAIAEKNLKKVEDEYEIGEYELISSDVEKIKDIRSDVVIQNPPFGVKKEHADRKFLVEAFKIAPLIYSLHKVESKNFIQKLSHDEGFEITEYFEFDFPLKQTMDFHKKRIQRIKVGCWKLEKIPL